MPEDPPVILDPKIYIARFRNRRSLMKLRVVNDAELLEALRFLRAEILAREVSQSFKTKGLPFITQCIQWLKSDQYKQDKEALKKPRLVPKTKLDLYPDK